MSDIVEHNKELCMRFPFLVIRDGKDEMPENYDYSDTVLDWMPEGWRIAFGEQMMQEIMNAIGEDIDDFRIVEMKEKFGQLRVYVFGGNESVYKVLRKYEDLSEHVCVKCGKPATKISLGWISPFCDDCGNEPEERYASVYEWFKPPTDD